VLGAPEKGGHRVPVHDPELPDPLIVRESRGACIRDRIAHFGMVVGITVLISAGCVDGRSEADEAGPDAAARNEMKSRSVAPDEHPNVAEARSAALRPGGTAAGYERLLDEGRHASGDALLALDERLKAAEAEYPLDFRFSYERAKLAVFGRHDHHEAFARLRRAAEKAIETGRSDSMLEMLRIDGARDGPHWKLSRGHSEWQQLHDALEHRDRDALCHEHTPETPVHAATPAAAKTPGAVDRLRAVRSRLSVQHSEHRAASGVGPMVEAASTGAASALLDHDD
jgi:hypothetical protein